MTLVTNKDLLLPATREAYAVGAFNISNLESLLAVTEAAVEENSPVVIAVSPTSIDYAGLTYIEKMIKIAAESAPVPMSLHLDHGKDIETVVRCLDAGFTSIMIDGSSLRFDDNVALTKRVVDLARPRDVSVEAELGRIAAVDECTTEEKQSILTDPESAKKFVELTDTDILAVAIGTSHGAYKFKGEPRLEFERLKVIRENVSVPLVLHGASSVPMWMIEKATEYGAVLAGARGITEEQIRKAISLGISKVNIDTDLRLAFTATVREFLGNSPQEFDSRKILGPAKQAMKEVVKDKMRLFGSSGKAS